MSQAKITRGCMSRSLDEISEFGFAAGPDNLTNWRNNVTSLVQYLSRIAINVVAEYYMEHWMLVIVRTGVRVTNHTDHLTQTND